MLFLYGTLLQLTYILNLYLFFCVKHTLLYVLCKYMFRNVAINFSIIKHASYYNLSFQLLFCFVWVEIFPFKLLRLNQYFRLRRRAHSSKVTISNHSKK